MKTVKLIIGIISIVLFIIVMFQSCAAGIVEAIGDTGGNSGGAGIFVAFCLLIAGIVGVATRNSKGGGITAGIFYAFGGIIGITNSGVYKDLIIWSILAFVFAIVFIVGSAKMPKKVKQPKQEDSQP
ncbi:MAG: hypothetical protein ACOX85_09580 [Candidatus Pararuminococcus gallinarum]|jgi:hypothetical protein